MKVFAILLALLLATTVSADNVVLGIFTPKGVTTQEAVVNTVATKELASDTWTTTLSRVEASVSFDALNQKTLYQRYGLSVGKYINLGDPALGLRVGGGLGIYTVKDGVNKFTEPGAFLEGQIRVTSDQYLQVYYTDIRNSTTGDGWGFGLVTTF